ncbi:MAG: hypothetical protein A3A04_01980 [Candidatus Harrisonbacteria bacterium RIFCSPLOWO2_01_FULL_40_28]|uniref:Uncharacterized protein n=1 Tax=Candidatus Harrisonbacteria bacterium RIFCSPLOWO2_01_FULL_40_28 TaxID=1798406 RepID=A0A1G1ZLD0_9BACT|nr:MAG: hypothetical protein A3A04_01980 [Candidatus Harrisonbacteria bacterium RIFCSPLOWO2_01_FULL_40_28]
MSDPEERAGKDPRKSKIRDVKHLLRRFMRFEGRALPVKVSAVLEREAKDEGGVSVALRRLFQKFSSLPRAAFRKRLKARAARKLRYTPPVDGEGETVKLAGREGRSYTKLEVARGKPERSWSL